MEKVATVIFLMAMLLVGCSRAPERLTGDFCELETRSTVPFATNAVPFEKLSDDDVLVAVNGYPLTKGVFNLLMEAKAKQLSSDPNSNPAMNSDKLENFKKDYLRTFVNQRILIDASRRLNAISQAEIEDKVNARVRALVEKRNVSIDKVFRSFPAPKKYVLYDLAAQYYIDRLITKHIPPKAEVNDEFVQAFRDEVKRQNEASDRGNEKIRKELKQFKADVLAGKVKFEDQAVAGEDVESKPGQVVWGVFERGSMDDPKVQAAAFALKAGEISDPVEDDDGIHLIKVYAIAAPEKNESGRVIQDEVRTLGHVYREKVPRMIEDEDAIMRKELRQQMQIQAINDFIQASTTNGTARIEYPHGKGVIK